MMREPLPFTGQDLRDIGEAVDEIEETSLAANALVGAIEIRNPDLGTLIGHVVRFDENDPDMGWGMVFDE